jgi:hypothetical protein
MHVSISESKYWRLDAGSQVPTGTDLIFLFLENSASRDVGGHRGHASTTWASSRSWKTSSRLKPNKLLNPPAMFSRTSYERTFDASKACLNRVRFLHLHSAYVIKNIRSRGKYRANV